jgi:hypothetical protein
LENLTFSKPHYESISCDLTFSFTENKCFSSFVWFINFNSGLHLIECHRTIVADPEKKTAILQGKKSINRASQDAKEKRTPAPTTRTCHQQGRYAPGRSGFFLSPVPEIILPTNALGGSEDHICYFC